MPANKSKVRRSRCPLNASVEIVGDRWSLLILRDMMLRGASTFHEFLKCPENIATNILADRLRKLQHNGLLTVHRDPSDGRRSIYRLTAKGFDLAPVLVELVLWADRHEPTGPHKLVQEIERDKAGFIARAQERWMKSIRGPRVPQT